MVIKLGTTTMIATRQPGNNDWRVRLTEGEWPANGRIINAIDPRASFGGTVRNLGLDKLVRIYGSD